MYKRPHYDTLIKRLMEPRRFIQVISGPRQVGKTTLIHQALEDITIPFHFASADETFADSAVWIEQQWETARLKKEQQKNAIFIIAIDEIQKIRNWSNVVKAQWDQDSRTKTDIRVVLLGSSRLLLEEGLTESLAGRFERIYLNHWPFSEMQAAFGLSPEEFVWFGGYPGAVSLADDERRWKDYIRNALIETTLSKDILQLTRIHKPALLKRLFEFSCTYSGQILSYSKMLGQLTDAGNTTTLSHYLDLLDSAGLVKGLENYSGSLVRTRSSSPKLQVLNTAFLSAYQAECFQSVRLQPDKWGRQVESAVGAHLANAATAFDMQLFYWRKRNDEVDFVLKRGDKVIGIEVKSGAARPPGGMAAFKGQYHPHKVLLVGSGGLPWEAFLSIKPEELF